MVSDHLGLVWQGWGMAWTALLGPNHGFDIFPTSKSRVSSGKLVRNIQKMVWGQNIDFFEIFKIWHPKLTFSGPKMCPSLWQEHLGGEKTPHSKILMKTKSKKDTFCQYENGPDENSKFQNLTLKT